MPLSGSAVMSLRKSGGVGKAFAGANRSTFFDFKSIRSTLVRSATKIHCEKTTMPLGSSRPSTKLAILPFLSVTEAWIVDSDAIIVGAGAAGLMAAIGAAERGRRILLLEKGKKPGVKILMSGGTRCNITHDCEARGIIEAFGPNGKFLHSALACLGPRETVAFFNAEGVATKVEE